MGRIETLFLNRIAAENYCSIPQQSAKTLNELLEQAAAMMSFMSVATHVSISPAEDRFPHLKELIPGITGRNPVEVLFFQKVNPIGLLRLLAVEEDLWGFTVYGGSELPPQRVSKDPFNSDGVRKSLEEALNTAYDQPADGGNPPWLRLPVGTLPEVVLGLA